MRQAAAYLGASLCLGWIAVFASENMFWTTPAPDLTLVGLAMAWGVYSLAAAAALSLAIWTGLGGWRGAFLGGALLGIFVEGAVVATMYDAFPLQLVWTPLAWHALITGLGVLGGGLALARGPVPVQLAGCLGFGLLGAVWGLYWPLEGKALAGLPGMLAYLGLAGVAAALALCALSRLQLSAPTGRVLWVAPGLIAGLWVAGSVIAPNPLRLLGPAMALLTVWSMRRLGRAAAFGAGGEPGGRGFGPPLPWSRCLLLASAPILTALVVVPAWSVLGGQPVNVAFALTTGAAGLGLWLWLLVAALRVRP